MRRNALKFASASEVVIFSPREGPPASILNQFFKISDFASDLESAKTYPKIIFLYTTAQTIPPANISTDCRAKIKVYRADFAQFTKTLPRCPKIRFTCSLLRRHPLKRILFDGKPNTVCTSHVISKITITAPQRIEIRVSKQIW